MFVGREAERAEARRVLSELSDGGSALLVRGAAGVGKSALLECWVATAGAQGVRVVRTRGVPSEAQLPHAGLHRLLLPFLGPAAHPSRPVPPALAAAVGLTPDAAPPAASRVALDALGLLSEAAAERPLLVVVEDGHWLDHDSCEALGFVARRLQMEPIALVCAVRTGHAGPWDRAGLPELELGPLSAAEAERLLDAHAPALPREVRAQVLTVAAGNPLALVELPAPLGAQPAGAGPLVPVPAAVREAFLDRAAGLSPAARSALLVAALDEQGGTEAVLGAAAAVAGRPVPLAELDDAERAGLVDLAGGRIGFRHPLVRAAVVGQAAPADRRAASAALARMYRGDPDRRVWHLADACAGPDDEVATALGEAGARALGRGAPGVAATALARAAELTTDPRARARLLLRAADAELQLGRADLAVGLLRRARPLDMADPDRAWLTLLLEAADPESWSGVDRVAGAAAIAARAVDAWDAERAVPCLLTVAHGCWHTRPGRDTIELVLAAARRIPLPDDEPALLAVLGCTDPVGQGAEVNARLRALHPAPDTDAVALHRIGTAATTVWAFDTAIRFLGPAIEGLRAQGRLGPLAQALLSQSWAALHVGRMALARSCAEEASRLARDTGQPIWGISADIVLATVAGERGRFADSERLARDAEAALIAMDAQPLLAEVAFARGRTAVAHQDHARGVERLRELVAPADAARRPHVASWAYADFVEAAAGTGRTVEARDALRGLEALAAATDGPLLQAQLAYARPLVAADDEAGQLFEDALGTRLEGWPCYRTRALLAYGRWLRRRRRIGDSRRPLRAARESADALGLAGLAELARQELRASGEGSSARRPQVWESLTPQESQIAQLAARGMSNRQIGEQLYLSHRTVASHLYRIFPKVGVSSRGQLAGSWAATRPAGTGVPPASCDDR